VAADLPDSVRAAVAAEQKRIASSLAGGAGSLRWVQPDHSHLTLVFLGHVDDPRVPDLVESIGRPVHIAAFTIALETLGVFPARGAPRVLWVGVGAGADALAAAQREISTRVAAVGIATEDRPFHPHLTLARWRESRPADRGRALGAAPRGVVARAEVNGVTLYRSQLSPSGPTYTPLAHASLRPAR